MRRASPKTGERLSLRAISARLAEAGYLNKRGKPFNPNSIKAMLVTKVRSFKSVPAAEHPELMDFYPGMRPTDPLALIGLDFDQRSPWRKRWSCGAPRHHRTVENR